MNIENLKPVKSKSEARERGKKGGKASAESRARKKNLKQCLQLLNSGTFTDDALRRNLLKMGMSEEEANNANLEMAIAVSLLTKALKGDTKAIQIYTNITSQNEEKTLEMRLKQAELKLKEKELELKEKELDAKLNGTIPEDEKVVIVNDLPND